MARLFLRLPDPVPTEMVHPVHYVKAFMQRNPEAAGLALPAAAKCRELRVRYPDDPFVFHLSGMVSAVNGNFEAAKALWGQALLVDPTYSDARQTLEQFLGVAGTDAFLKKLAKGVDFLRQESLQEARRLLKAGKPMEADGFVQKVCALMNPDYSPLADMASCVADTRRLMDAGQMEAALNACIESLEGLWARADEAAVEEAQERFSAAPDRRQFADIVVKLVRRRRVKGVTCFELGCFNGFNLNLVRETLGADKAKRVSFHGLEPNAAAVAYCRRHYPYVNIHQGTHADLVADAVDLPETLDVCMVGRVFQMMRPADVVRVLGWLARRARYLVIADDVVNVDGDFPVIRTPLYVMHNFRQPMEAAGFDIVDVVFAENPDRSCTGFIVARRSRTR